MAASSFDLDTVLLQMADGDGYANWTIRDAVEGLQIFGGIGSGKTSGSGRFLAQKFLASGFGGLILTVKHDEKLAWQQYCNATNRTDDLIIVEPRAGHYFNFLEYETTAKEPDQSFTENIVQVLKTVISASKMKSSGKEDDQFWETALDMLMFNIIEMCQLAYGRVTVPMLYDIAQTVPKKTVVRPTAEEMEKEKAKAPTAFTKTYNAALTNVEAQINAYRQELQAAGLKGLTREEFEDKIEENMPDARKMRYISQFFSETFKQLNDKTRSIIDFMFSGFLFRLLQDPIYSLFCYHTSNFLPEDCFNSGKIILINLPVKRYDKVGRDVQIMFKYIWQRAMERRDIEQNGRPVFLWADEAQNFLHEYDADYQATARSSRIATVYISQNLPNYYANMGGKVGEFKVKSFIGTLATKIFHANADIETNTYASDLIGEAYQANESGGSSSSQGSLSSSQNLSSELVKMVRPEMIVGLKTGGPLNNYKVSAYIHVQGKQFADHFNHKKIHFNQKSGSNSYQTTQS